METVAGLIKLKPGTEPTVRAWRETLEQRQDEALQTLRDEGIAIESWFQMEIGGEQYLLWYIRAESIARAREIAGRSTHAVDEYHFDVMSRITDRRIDASLLLHLTTDT